LVIALVAMTAMLGQPAAAQTPRVPPAFDPFASPLTETELTGFGCVAASALTAGALAWALGGAGAVVGALRVPMSQLRVMEAAAATAFIFSSACYVGQATAPLAFLLYTSVADRVAPLPPVEPK
jgi:hypothetical protein